MKYALRPWASVGYFVIFAVAAAAGLVALAFLALIRHRGLQPKPRVASS